MTLRILLTAATAATMLAGGVAYAAAPAAAPAAQHQTKASHHAKRTPKKHKSHKMAAATPAKTKTAKS